MTNTNHNEIISQPHHRSLRHLPMSEQNRAAQFAPYAALTGYEGVILETARLTQTQTELAEDRKAELDACLQALQTGDTIAVAYFKPDRYKSGGAYVTACGVLKYIDPVQRILKLTDGTEISIDAITDISG